MSFDEQLNQLSLARKDLKNYNSIDEQIQSYTEKVREGLDMTQDTFDKFIKNKRSKKPSIDTKKLTKIVLQGLKVNTSEIVKVSPYAKTGHIKVVDSNQTWAGNPNKVIGHFSPLQQTATNINAFSTSNMMIGSAVGSAESLNFD